MFKIPTKTANCDQETSRSFTFCRIFALERNYFRITASYDKIFGKMSGAAYVRSFHNIIIYSFFVKRVPAKKIVLGTLMSLEIKI